MAVKKKKEKKAPKENKDQLSAVDKTFYELTINDLNNKLSHLRSHNAKLEERNAELETNMVQMEEDRSDVTAYLNRTLNTQANNIKDFEEKLTQLARVRAEETERFQAKLQDWQNKFKTMHDQLTSEIKLLTGKLNSLEEFRIQKDELMAKFDQQENDLKEQNQRHKETLYELERKQILDKDRLKIEVENRLLQLSNEFAKSNEIRISAHVQRMVRENIALNNELDRLVVTTERLMADNKRIGEHNNEQRLYTECVLEENARLVDVCKKRLRIIDKLTAECERIKEQSQSRGEADKHRQMAEVREMTARKELIESKNKMMTMQKDIIIQKHQCKSHTSTGIEYQKEINRLTSILRHLKQTVSKTLDTVDTANNDESHRMQRIRLLDEIHSILMGVNELDEFTVDETSEVIKSRPFHRDSYHRGRIGITPVRKSTQQLFKYSHSTYKGRKPSFIGPDPAAGPRSGQSPIGSLIIDAGHGILPSSDSMRVDDNESLASDGKTPEPAIAPSPTKMGNVSSSDDEKWSNKFFAQDAIQISKPFLTLLLH